jgi:type II secretory pathway component PulK
MNRRGSVFILFLWVMILMSFFAMSVGFRTRLAAKIEGYELKRFELTYDFLSAVNLARFFIESDEDPNVDFKGDAWYGAPREFKKMDFSERFDLSIADEGSKIDLNKAQEPFLVKFFEVLKDHDIKLETEPKKLASSILAWRGMVTGPGSPTSLGSQVEQKRRPFESVEELRLIQYISTKDFETLRPFFTAASGSVGGFFKVNLNTVHPYILEALILYTPSPAAGESLRRSILEKIEGFRGSVNDDPEDDQTKGASAALAFGQADLKPQGFIEKLRLGNSIQVVQFVSYFIQYFASVNSEIYSVRVRSRIPKKESFTLNAVLGPRMLQGRLGMPGINSPASMGKPVTVPLEILSWRESVT